jgi:multimeric flavodoxin WrbA
MKIMIVQSSPNKNGLTAACAEQARQGCLAVGADVFPVRLKDLQIGICRTCNRETGWGPCLNKHFCQLEDDFSKLHAQMKEMDGFIFITPVYWWDMSEAAKAFMDRLRRCESFKTGGHYLGGKPVLNIAAAGGTGNGIIPCLAAMEKYIDQIKGLKYDFIGVTRRNREYKLKTVYEAAATMAAGQEGE